MPVAWFKLTKLTVLFFEINLMVHGDTHSYSSVNWTQMETLLFIYRLPWCIPKLC